MGNLINPQETIRVIQENEFTFHKKFGQNFLVDSHVLNKIIAGAGLSKEDVVLEIGPGIGTITQALCENAKQVIAVEIDKDLIPILNGTLSSYDNAVIINEDIMNVDLQELKKKYSPDRNIKVVANLPYYITTPIIMKLFESRLGLDNITVMVQKEVAEKMQAEPGSRGYGLLSLAMQYFAEPYITAYVPQNCFIPRPTIGSAVVTLRKYDEPVASVDDEALMFRIIKAAFNQRRKTLQNALSNDDCLSINKEDAQSALREMGLSETIRGETLSIQDFANFTNLLMRNSQ